MDNYNIQVGQIYVAADGSQSGHLVVDVDSYASCGDVCTMPFSSRGWDAINYRIDAFKLAMVRYKLVTERPEWMPR